MDEIRKGGISRRQFARRAALVSAGASIVPAARMFAESPVVAAQQPAGTHPNLTPESHAEAEARYEQILSQYGSRFSAEEKTSLREMNLVTQESLDKVRAYPLENGDGPALYLKPLVEREKKPAQAPAAGPAKKS
jgi:hypothetical protein